jgi:hypothetical protein
VRTELAAFNEQLKQRGIAPILTVVP